MVLRQSSLIIITVGLILSFVYNKQTKESTFSAIGSTPDTTNKMRSSTSNSNGGGTITTTKQVYLIRHAESLENQRIKSLKRCVGSLSRFSLPSKADLSMSAQFLNLGAQVDSDVSNHGQQQIEQSAELINNHNDNDDGNDNGDFVKQKGIQLVVHSPLKRARETSRGMLGCAYPDMKHKDVSRVVQLDQLEEKSPVEWIPGNAKSFKKRIVAFEQWLEDQPENVIAVVGHSQFFKAMLGMDYKFGNCDVWSVLYHGNNDNNGSNNSNGNVDVIQEVEVELEEKRDNNENSCTSDSNIININNREIIEKEKEQTSLDDDNVNINNKSKRWKSLTRMYSIDNDAQHEESWSIRPPKKEKTKTTKENNTNQQQQQQGDSS